MTAAANSIPAHLESVLGANRIFVAKAANREPYSVDGVAPSAIARPANAGEAVEIIRFAAKENLTVVPIGARTKLFLGPTPSRYDVAIDLSALDEIAHYDPADLTVSVGAGIPIAKLNAALSEHNQFLPLLVPYYSHATIGGIIASGIDSPLRNAYGTARDFLLGAEFIDGTGAQVKSGGRVVKNVTGYDLHKLLIGSQGTLAAITRLNFRTFPTPQSARGFVAAFESHEAALTAQSKIAHSQLTPLTLDVLNPAAAKIFATRTPNSPELAVFPGESHQGQGQSTAVPLPTPGEWFKPNQWQLCAAFSGNPDVLDRYARDLTQAAEQSSSTSIAILDDTTRPSIWARLRESLALFRESTPHAAILKLTIPPSRQIQAATVLHSVAEAANVTTALIFRAAGPIQIAILAQPESATEPAAHLLLLAREIVSLARTQGGRAELLSAPQSLKPQIQSILNSHPRPDHAQLQRLKSAFDPKNIFRTSEV